MSLGCGMRDGDLMAWRSVTSGVIGDAHVHYDTSACRDVTGNAPTYVVHFRKLNQTVAS